MLKVCVVGDGPIAHSIAGICGARMLRVNVLSKAPSMWGNHLKIQYRDQEPLIGAINTVTSDPELALHNVSIIFLCVRHYEVEKALNTINPYLKKGMLLGGVPGFGGFGFRTFKLKEAGLLLFGLQRIPFVVNGVVLGQSISISGVRRQSFVGTIPSASSESVAKLISNILGVKTVPLSNYINVELSPSNSIVNPVRLYSLFANGANAKPGEEFFLGWDEESTRLLLNIDKEMQDGKRLIPRDTSFVAPLLFQYDANNAETLTKRFRSLTTLSGRPIPVLPGKTFQPDLESDYFKEDIDIGLKIQRDMLKLSGAETPLMNKILNWRASIAKGSFHFEQIVTDSFKNITELSFAFD